MLPWASVARQLAALLESATPAVLQDELQHWAAKGDR
jgi:hypothetical protein